MLLDAVVCGWVAGGGRLTIGEAWGVSSPVARNGERGGGHGRLVVAGGL